ncbi:MAG TPA: hypothetical protein VN046_03975 [Stenotrophobium sp.]|jgi:hypothetical protein|nr:hypothetical protein [Stenotrophobium sp.]
MRKLLVGIAASVFISGTITLAEAAGPDFSNPQTRAYVNLAFGGSDAHSSLANGLHYGLRLDRNDALGRSGLAPAISQLDFNASGFSDMSVNGVPFLSRSLQLNEDGQSTSFTVFDWGLLAAGVAGLGFAVYEVTKSKESPDPVTKTTTVSTPNGNVVVTTVNGIVTTVVDTVTGLGIPLSTVTAPVTAAICSATTVLGGLLCPTFSSSNDRALSSTLDERETRKHLEWLNSDNGHMGDLYAIQ